jgi:DNA-directed RNA polymerase specialized sigma24 family protein
MTVIDEVRTRSRSEIISEWYINVFPLVAAYVQRNGGDLHVAKEVFQEAIVLYYEKWNDSGFSPKTNDEAYLMGIARNQWHKHYSSQKRYEALAEIDMVEESEKELITQKVLHYLKLTGGKCMDILQAFYYEKIDMSQLAKRFGYRSVRSATVQKYKCLEKVRDNIKHKSLSYEDFFN